MRKLKLNICRLSS